METARSRGAAVVASDVIERHVVAGGLGSDQAVSSRQVLAASRRVVPWSARRHREDPCDPGDRRKLHRRTARTRRGSAGATSSAITSWPAAGGSNGLASHVPGPDKALLNDSALGRCEIASLAGYTADAGISSGSSASARGRSMR